MGYNTIVIMASSPSLAARVTAAAAEQGSDSPQQWAEAHIWHVASEPGWAASWESATVNYDPNVNPDTGYRNDVITDAMILSAVQGIMLEEATPAPPGQAQ